MATRRAKPNGQHLADSERLAEYMLNEKVTDLPGIVPLESFLMKWCFVTHILHIIYNFSAF